MSHLKKTAWLLKDWLGLVLFVGVSAISALLMFSPLGCRQVLPPSIRVSSKGPYDSESGQPVGPFPVTVRDKDAESRCAAVKLKLVGDDDEVYDSVVDVLSSEYKTRVAYIDGGYSWELYMPSADIPSGTHTLHGDYMDDTTVIVSHQVDATFGNPAELAVPGPAGLSIWSGNHTYGSPGESIVPCRTYDMWVRVCDANGTDGLDLETVTFTLASENVFDATVYPQTTSTWWKSLGSARKLHGLAGAQLTFKSQCVQDCSVKVKWSPPSPQGAESVEFHVHYVDDTEEPLSNNLGLWETRYSSPAEPVCGDGLWNDGQGNGDPDVNGLDLLVELDYDPDLGLMWEDINSAVTWLQDIYETIGVSVSVTIDEYEVVRPLPSSFGNRHELRGWLATYRNRSELIGLGRGGVHVIVGGDFDNDGGLAVGYRTVGAADVEVDQYSAAARAMPNEWPHGTSAWLDSCGVFVFTKAIVNQGNWEKYQVLGWALAHELGHAIGLEHIDWLDQNEDLIPNVMTELPLANVTSRWTATQASVFIENSHGDAKANLRRLLGRETILIWWPPGCRW